MNYTLSVENITDIAASVIIAAPEGGFGGTYTLAVSTGGTAVFTSQIMAPPMDSGDTITTPVTGLTANTAYEVTLEEIGNAAATPINFTTKKIGYDEPKTATQDQWEDLANRVKRAPVITMSSTDPGEGVPLAENHFIAYYE